MTCLKVLEINLQPGSKIGVYNNQKSSFVLWLRWKQENTLTKTMTYRVMTVFCKLNWINILSWASRLSLFLWHAYTRASLLCLLWSVFCWIWHWKNDGKMTLIKSAEPELIQARNYTLCKRSHAFKYCLLKAQEEVSFFHIQQIDFLILCQFSLANSVISEYAWARVYADNSNLLSAIPALPSHWDSNLYPHFSDCFAEQSWFCTLFSKPRLPGSGSCYIIYAACATVTELYAYL